MPRHLGRIRPSNARLKALPRFARSAPIQSLPDPPTSIILPESIATPAYSGTLGNTTAGNCTIAGVLRCQQRWSAETRSKPLRFTDAQALADYSSVTGYDPATGANDTGCVETDVLDRWQSQGFEGNQIRGYTSMDPQNVVHIKQSIWVYGGIYLGLNLPSSAEEQTDAGQPWTLPWFWPRVLGGHCVVGFEYDESYLYVGTWGVRQPVAWDFVSRYFDAAYAVIDVLWLLASGKSPGGLSLVGLTADLNYVCGQ